MKITGKFPLDIISKKLSEKDKALLSNNSNSSSLVSIDIKELNKKEKKSFSIELLNYVEPYNIKGQLYTLFYTEVDHNLKIGDKIFITGGYYDSDLIIKNNKFSKLACGYTVQYVDRTKVVLNIEYTGDLPYIDEPIDNFVKVYVASTQREFDYFIQTISYRDYDYVTNRFSSYGTFSNNNFLYINGTFSLTGSDYGILGFTNSGVSYLTYSNSFLILNGTSSGYLQDITNDVINGSYSYYLSSGLYNNGGLKIVNSPFDISGINFIDGYSYIYENNWIVDIRYSNPIITEQNFRNGIFKKGEFNQGLFGTHKERLNYIGTDIKFNLGSVLNTNWLVGDIGSGYSGNESFFTSFDEYGLPVIKSNDINNSGIGYNHIYNSSIKSSNIDNGTFNDSIIGSISSTLVLNNYIKSDTITYSVNINGGNYFDSNINYSFISNSSIFSSNVYNSNVSNSKSINSEFEKSLFINSKYTSDKIIKIEKYDEKYLTWYDGDVLKQYKLYKFYISENSFNRLDEFQSFYFDGLSINKNSLPILNFFDDKFTIDSYRSSFDNYDDYKTDNKVIIQLSTKEENYKIPNGINGDFILNDNYGYPSIDIFICATPSINTEDFNSRLYLESYGPYIFDMSVLNSTPSWGTTTTSTLQILYSGGIGTISCTFSDSLYNELVNLSIGSWTYSGDIFSVTGTYSYNSMIFTDGAELTDISIFSTQSTRFAVSEDLKTLDIKNSYIIDSDFKSGLFKDSNWISGNYINYNKDNSLNVGIGTEYYDPMNIDNLGNLEFSIYPNYRNELFNTNDILFINGLYYDSILNGGDNLVKLPETYQVDSISSGGIGRIIKISDPIYGTSSVLYNLISSMFTNDVTTKFAKNSYNYLHPVKFENSKIQSGIFRRAYFKGCNIDNQLFDNLEKDPINYKNWRSLLLSDILFSDNGNTIKSGLILNSSFTSGTDVWENGIFHNSIWNVQSFTWSNSATGSNINTTSINKFKNGIFKESTWVNGIFENGLFYKNKSNTPFSEEIFTDSKKAYYKNRDYSILGLTRYSWQNGIFENGLFELSNFETGLFLGGDFYNSTFLDGEAKSGNFGKRNLKYQLTRASSGTFSNLNVISAEFKTENPTGATSGIFNIDWYSGVFNNGLFGVKVDEYLYNIDAPGYNFNSIWHDGTFNNGTFEDISIWKGGEFNNGKFISYYGYPYVTVASYSSAGSSSYAWQSGVFNGGEFGNASLGTNSTWYNGEFNGGIFRGRYWNNGILTKGYFIGSGTSSTSLNNISNYVSDFSNDFYGLWNDGFVSEVKDIAIKDKKIYTKLEREFTRKKSQLNVEFKNSLWRNGTFSHNNAIMENSVWTGGAFLNGKFYKSSFNPYLNYIVNGNFQLTDPNNIGGIGYWDVLYSDYDMSGDIIGGSADLMNNGQYTNDQSVKLQFVGTSSILNLTQTTGLVIGDTYTVRLIIDENYNNEIRFGNWSSSLRNRNLTEGNSASFSNWILSTTSSTTLPSLTIVTGSPGYIEYSASSLDSTGYIIYPNILDVGKSYTLKFYTFDESSFTVPYIGSCDSSQVTIENEILETDFIVNSNFTYSVPTGGSNEYFINFEAEYNDLIIKIVPSSISSSYKLSSFILTGNTVLISSDVSSRTSLSYTFNAVGPDMSIEFIPKSIPSVNSLPSWDIATCSILNIEVVKGTSGFNIDDSCYWENGVLEESEFYISKWDNGKWISGTSVGMIWKNGVANYMNAYNVYWEGGVWRNGNWNGSPFNYENVNENGCLYTYDSIEILNLDSPWNNLDLGTLPGGSSRIYVDFISNGATLSFVNSTLLPGVFTASYRDSELDVDNSGSFVNTYGLPFINSTTPNQFDFGKRYKVTIDIGTVSIANASDLDKVGLQFSIGKPSSENVSYGESSGTYSGSIYPAAILVAPGEDFISDFKYLSDFDGHIGSVVESLLIDNVDGYLSSYGGSFTEVITSSDDGKFYLHINPYGVSEFYINSISIQEENCTKRIVVNEGYASDILTNISIYRNSINDSTYQDIFINDAFTVSIDTTWPNVIDQPDITSLSFTQSGVGNAQKWKYSPTWDENTTLINCGGYRAWSQSSQNYNTNYYTDVNTSNYLYAVNTNNSINIFTSLGQYDIKMKYILQYAKKTLPIYNGVSSTVAPAKFKVEVGYLTGVNNGGFYEEINVDIDLYRVLCNSNDWFGTTKEMTWTGTFNPTSLGATFSDLDTFKVKKISTVSGVKMIITSLEIFKKTSQYDPIYNNATYSIMGLTPSYDDTLLLPSIDLIGGQSNGNIISTRFGNGMFTSGTASSFSSVWENGVWNEGYRHDNYLYTFGDLGYFSGTSKPFSFSGYLDIKSPKIGNIPSDIDRNLTKRVNSRKNWIITLDRNLNGEPIKYINDGSYTYEQKSLIECFKVGDKVSVGNVVCLDINNKRRLIRDYFTVVDVTEDLIYLQVTINFPIRKISKDSENHLIYISKNIWMNGAFLNGRFRGVWNNGLFKGRPYLTKMENSQWIDGRFDGGTFKGLTLSILEDVSTVDEDVTKDIDISYYNSGLIQNFNFKDNDQILDGYSHKYNSWIDVNYSTYSTVTLGRPVITYDTGGLITASVSYGEIAKTNYFSLPTVDVLSSESELRNNGFVGSAKYSLGYKFTEYENYLSSITDFNNYYNSDNLFGTDKLISDGFTYSRTGYKGKLDGTFSFISNESSINENMLEIRTLQNVSFGAIGVLDNSNSEELVKGRYSYISFDIDSLYISGKQDSDDVNEYNAIAYDYLDQYNSNVWSSYLQLTVDKGSPAGYGVIKKGYLNLLNRPSSNIKEYFYNRKGLKLTFGQTIIGSTPSSFRIKNLKLVETDMIPFFSLGTASSINQSILAPFNAVAPQIDYSDSEFSLIDSIYISETIFETSTNQIINITSGGTNVASSNTSNTSILPINIGSNVNSGTQIN